jgi:hypothetical protein
MRRIYLGSIQNEDLRDELVKWRGSWQIFVQERRLRNNKVFFKLSIILFIKII